MTDEIENLPLLDHSDDGFVDLSFRIVEVEHAEDTIRINLRARHEGEVVGMKAVVSAGLRAGFSPSMELLNVARPGIRFERSGDASDKLIAALARLYSARQPDRMVEMIDLAVIAMHQESLDVLGSPVKLKCFGCDSEAEIESGAYFECFFNFDLASRTAEWNEKDTEYRLPMINALSC